MSTTSYDYGMWAVAAFNVGLFLFFVLNFLAPRGRTEWRNMGVVIAFLVALFSDLNDQVSEISKRIKAAANRQLLANLQLDSRVRYQGI